MTESSIISTTDFTKPDEIVLNFIQSTKSILLGRKPNSDDKDLKKNIMEIIHFYSAKKYHPYRNYIIDLFQIKNIKEIEEIKTIDKNQVHIYTKKIRNLTPQCQWTLKLKNKKWKIDDIALQRNINEHHSLFS